MILPNLQELTNKAAKILDGNFRFAQEVTEAQLKNNGFSLGESYFDCEVFRQVYGKALDLGMHPADNYVYITVIRELFTDIYIVFIDDVLTYVISEPTEVFKNDLKEKRLKTVNIGNDMYNCMRFRDDGTVTDNVHIRLKITRNDEILLISKEFLDEISKNDECTDKERWKPYKNIIECHRELFLDEVEPLMIKIMVYCKKYGYTVNGKAFVNNFTFSTYQVNDNKGSWKINNA